jgi:hypothetical protein
MAKKAIYEEMMLVAVFPEQKTDQRTYKPKARFCSTNLYDFKRPGLDVEIKPDMLAKLTGHEGRLFNLIVNEYENERKDGGTWVAMVLDSVQAKSTPRAVGQ